MSRFPASLLWESSHLSPRDTESATSTSSRRRRHAAMVYVLTKSGAHARPTTATTIPRSICALGMMAGRAILCERRQQGATRLFVRRQWWRQRTSCCGWVTGLAPLLPVGSREVCASRWLGSAIEVLSLRWLQHSSLASECSGHTDGPSHTVACVSFTIMVLSRASSESEPRAPTPIALDWQRDSRLEAGEVHKLALKVRCRARGPVGPCLGECAGIGVI